MHGEPMAATWIFMALGALGAGIVAMIVSGVIHAVDRY